MISIFLHGLLYSSILRAVSNPPVLEVSVMTSNFPLRSLRVVLTTALALAACMTPAVAQTSDHAKILGGYFEEWSIYYAGYNIANLQQNGVADKLTHLLYAFAKVTTTPTPACAIAASWADYQKAVPQVPGA